MDSQDIPADTSAPQQGCQLLLHQLDVPLGSALTPGLLPLIRPSSIAASQTPTRNLPSSMSGSSTSTCLAVADQHDAAADQGEDKACAFSETVDPAACHTGRSIHTQLHDTQPNICEQLTDFPVGSDAISNIQESSERVLAISLQDASQADNTATSKVALSIGTEFELYR